LKMLESGNINEESKESRPEGLTVPGRTSVAAAASKLSKKKGKKK